MKARVGVFVWVLVTAIAHANSSSVSLPVSATHIPTVSVTATSLDFGTWVIGERPPTATATITVKAQSGVTYAITLDAGEHFSGGAFRQVANGDFLVPYAISTPFHSLWGDAGFANTYPRGGAVAATGPGLPQAFVVRGDLLTPAAHSGSPAGTYTDYVTVTVYW